jgi:hypothetical protein
MNKSYDTNMEKIQIYIIIFSHSCLSPLLVEHNPLLKYAHHELFQSVNFIFWPFLELFEEHCFTLVHFEFKKPPSFRGGAVCCETFWAYIASDDRGSLAALAGFFAYTMA